MNAQYPSLLLIGQHKVSTDPLAAVASATKAGVVSKIYPNVSHNLFLEGVGPQMVQNILHFLAGEPIDGVLP